MIRLFIGLPIASHVRQLLSSLGATIPGARAVPEDQIHLTLRFIGEVDALTFGDIKDSLEGLEAPSLTLSINGAGHFPPGVSPGCCGRESIRPGMSSFCATASIIDSGFAELNLSSENFTPMLPWPD